MSLTDDPFYKKLTEGYDTKLIVGTLGITINTPEGPRTETFAVFLVDYFGAPEDMDSAVEAAFKDVKRIDLATKDGTYFISVGDRRTVAMFSEGETAVHTAPEFAAEYTPAPEEHEAFQKELSQKGVWLLMIITRTKLREILMHQSGKVIFQRTVPLTEDLKKMLGVE